MKRVRYGLAAATAIMLTTGVATAANSQVELSGNVSIVSDYIFRGITQTSEQAAIQGGIDVGLPYSLYVGAWGSSVHFADDDPAAAELDLYGGIAPTVSGVDLDLGLIYYGYPAAGSANYDFIEVYGGASRAFGPVTAGLTGAYSPEFFGESGPAFFGQAAASAGIPNTPLTLDVSLGRQWLEEVESVDPSYLVWTAGASVDVLGVSLLGTVSGTDIDEDHPLHFAGLVDSDPRFTIGISRGL